MKSKQHYWAEFLGTFLLVFIGTGSCVIGDEFKGFIDNFGIAIVFGVTVWILIQFFGRFSDCHINPAVTFCFFVKNEISTLIALRYIALQCIGAILASLSLYCLFPENKNLGNTLPSGSWQEAFMYEVFLSFALILVILVTTSTKFLIKLAPFLIGLTVFVEAWFAGPVSGASMNPARSFGPSLVSGNCTFLWLYCAAPILGMQFGLWFFRFQKKISLT